MQKKLYHIARKSWEIRFPILLLSTIFIGTIYAYMETPKLKHVFRNFNKSILSTRIYIPDLFSPSFDPVLDRIYREASSRQFDFTSTKSSALVAAFMKDHPEFAASGKAYYKNIFELLREQYVNRNYKYELIIIGDYIMPRLSKTKYQSSIITSLLYYLEIMYYEPISNLLRSHQFGRAKKYASRLNAIMKLVDIPPLGVVDPYTQERLNKLILLNILMTNAKTLFSDVETVSILHDAIDEGFESWSYTSEISTRSKIQTLHKKLENNPTSDIYKMVSYWDGVYLLRQKDYQKAWERFRESGSNHILSELREASILMQARCLFWLYIDTFDSLRCPQSETQLLPISGEIWNSSFIPIYKKTTNILSILKENSTNSNYQNDIVEYINKVEDKKKELSRYVSDY